MGRNDNSGVTQKGKLIIVNPNKVINEHGLTPLEDLSISVDLTSTSFGKSVINVNANGKIDISNIGEKKSTLTSFLSGSNINGKQTLTTNFTNINNNLSNSGDNNEALGIKSIDISFNSSYTPIVKIHMFDVRGGSVFSAGNKSKYNVFFNLPYPIFNLTVKGFYGKTVTYCLHLTKFTTAFNSESAGFDIQAEFIGYTYAFLSDMLVGHMMGIVETPEGNDLFNKARTQYNLENNNNQSIIKLTELRAGLSELNKAFETIESTSQDAARLTKGEYVLDLLKDYKKYVEEIPKLFYNEFNSVDRNKTKLKNVSMLQYSNNYTIYTSQTSDAFTTLYKTINYRIDDYIKKIKELNPEIILTKYELKESRINNYKAVENNDLITKEVKSQINTILSVNNNKNKIYQNIPFVIVAMIDSEIKKYDNRIKELKLAVAEEFQISINKNVGIKMNLYNIINSLVVHSEVFIRLLYKLGQTIEASPRMRERVNNFPNNNTDVKKIYPFPIYYDNKKNEELWLGDLPNSDKFDEVEFVEALLAGMIAVKREENEREIEINPVYWTPFGLLDTTDKNSPYNINDDNHRLINSQNPENLINIILRRFFYLTTYSYPANGDKTNRNIFIQTSAKLEAQNILSSFTNSDVLINLQNKTGDEIIKNASDKNNKFYGNGKVSTLGVLNETVKYEFFKNKNNTTILSINGSYERDKLMDGKYTIPLDDYTNTVSLSDSAYIISEENNYYTYNNDVFNFNFIDYIDPLNISYIGTDIINNSPLNKETLLNLDDLKQTDVSLINFNPYNGSQGVTEFNYFKSNKQNFNLKYLFFNKFNEIANTCDNPLNQFFPDVPTINIGNDYNNVFGTYIYNTQKTDEARAFLYLQSIGLKSMNYIEIYNIFAQYGGHIHTNNAWILYMGSIYWRRRELGGTNTHLNTKDPIKTWGPYDNSEPNEYISYTELYVGAYSKEDVINYVPKFNELFNISESHRFNPDEYYKDGLMIINKHVENLFINKFKNWVSNDTTNNGWGELSKRLEYLDRDKFINLTPHDWKVLDMEYVKNNMLNPNVYDYYLDTNHIYRSTPNDAYLNLSLYLLPKPITQELISVFNVTTKKNNEKGYNWKNVEFKNIEKLEYKDIVNASKVEFDILNNTEKTRHLYEGIKDLISTEVIIKNPTPNIWNTESHLSDENIIKVDQLSLYLDTLINEVKNNSNKILKITDEKAIKQTIFNTTDDTRIKLNIYRNLRSIYNKWVAGYQNNNSCIKLNIEDNQPFNFINSFEFRDRAFNDIGHEILVNPQQLSNYIYSDWNSSMYTVISRILEDNNLLFIPLPSYINFKDVGEVRKMFIPQPYSYSCNDSMIGPSFVCVYVGNYSNTLDTGDINNPDDSISFELDCNENFINMEKIPSDFTEEPVHNNKGGTNTTNNIVVFEVNYSDQQQSIFSNIQISQDEFNETDEGLRITEDISKQGTNTRKTFMGQNLFNLYQTRQYSCNVTAMGNPTIQPMMYFQLNGIPVFRGGYFIDKVDHHIEPNKMITKFRGNRISRYKVPLITENEISMKYATNMETGFDKATIVGVNPAKLKKSKYNPNKNKSDGIFKVGSANTNGSGTNSDINTNLYTKHPKDIKIAFIVGHTESKQGAGLSTQLGKIGTKKSLPTTLKTTHNTMISEWDYWQNLYNESVEWQKLGPLFIHENIGDYSDMLNNMENRIKEYNPDLLIELHFNGGNNVRFGSMCIYVNQTKKDGGKYIDTKPALGAITGYLSGMEKIFKIKPDASSSLTKPGISLNPQRGGGICRMAYRVGATGILVEPFYNDGFSNTLTSKNQLLYDKNSNNPITIEKDNFVNYKGSYKTTGAAYTEVFKKMIKSFADTQ